MACSGSPAAPLNLKTSARAMLSGEKYILVLIFYLNGRLSSLPDRSGVGCKHAWRKNEQYQSSYQMMTQ
jgi:hypothetical protein